MLKRLEASEQTPLQRTLVKALVLLVLLVAGCYRLYHIDRAPPGPHYDEAAAALDALDVLDGQHTVFSPRSYGREMLFAYVLAPFVATLGPTRLALRLPTALAGTLTVLGVYCLVRELFGGQDRRQAQRLGGSALLASVLLALSFWHVVLSRISFRANYLPLVEVLCFLFLCRGARIGRSRDYAAGGFFLGLSLYTYTAARMLPVVVVLFLVTLLPTRQGRVFAQLHWRRWVLSGTVAFLVSVPLVVYFSTHPEDFVLRAKGVSVFSEHLHKGQFWNLLARSVAGNLALFGFRGDPDWTFNVPCQSGLDVVQALLFWLGIVLCLVRWRRPAYRFLLIWWLVMLLPSILAPDPIPHCLRAIGTLPVVCILSARSAKWLWSHMTLRLQRLGTAAPLALLVGLSCYLAWLGYNTWHSYFDVWLPRDQVYYAYYGHMADLAKQISCETDPQTVYLFPVNYDRRGDVYSEYSLELLHRGTVPVRYIAVDTPTVAHDLTKACQGKRRVHLIVWTHGEHVDADPRQVLPFMLERCGHVSEERAFRGYRIVTYELDSAAADLTTPLSFTAGNAVFDDQLRLVAWASEADVASGETALIALRWQALQHGSGNAVQAAVNEQASEKPAVAEDWKASLRLVDSHDRLVAQSDVMLLSNEHETSSQWVPGQEVTTYHQLSIPPGTFPSTCQIILVLYDPDTLNPAQVLTERDEGGHEGCRDLDLALSSLEIGRPLCSAAAELEEPLTSVLLAPNIELVGYELDRELVMPGEAMRLALYWHACGDISSEYSVALRLIGDGGETIGEWVEEPTYPTSEWQTGDWWRDWHNLRVAPDVPAGECEVVVSLCAEETERLPQVRLGKVEVQGRSSIYQEPSITHPMVVEFGQEFRLLGYDLGQEQVVASEALSLTLYWQTVAESDVSYTVFTHLLDGDSRIWGQKDSLPVGGALPTILWLPGEIIIDQYEILVDADAPAGEYEIEIGMYQADTNQRLTLRDDTGEVLGNRLLLDTKILVSH